MKLSKNSFGRQKSKPKFKTRTLFRSSDKYIDIFDMLRQMYVYGGGKDRLRKGRKDGGRSSYYGGSIESFRENLSKGKGDEAR